MDSLPWFLGFVPNKKEKLGFNEFCTISTLHEYLLEFFYV